MSLRPEEILSYFQQESGGPLRLRDLVQGLAVPASSRRELRRVLRQLADDGHLARTGRGRYVLIDRGDPGRGLLVGYGEDLRFVGSRDPDAVPARVPPDWAGGAFHGDEVEVRLTSGPAGPLARVVRIVRRSPRVVLASYREARPSGYAVPQDPRLPPRIYLEEAPPAARAGDLLLVEMAGAAAGGGPPLGRVARLLGGREEDHRFYRLLQEFSLPLAFPERVLAETARLPTGLVPGETAGRLDLRGELVFTIDPVDAYDHDDAVSLRVTPDGSFQLGVHIADVSHFVAAGSALDREALARGNSVYLDEGVVPMFPEELTRGILSLVPDEDRLALSVLANLSPEGTPLEFRLAPTVIRSRRRLTYEEAENCLEGDGDGELGAALGAMGRLADLLRERRGARGALDLEVAERGVIWGATGEPLRLVKRQRLRSHRLIEEFMLLANETVARYLGQCGQPLVYRIHEPPTPERLEELDALVRPLGYHLGTGDPARALGSLLRKALGTPLGELVSLLVLRSMRKAVYSERNLGHFGLASGNYTHFTSPIRRYADLSVHRALRQVWEETRGEAALEPQPWGADGGARGAPVTAAQSRRRRVPARALAQVAEHATRRELLADEVERASFAQAAARYMQACLGEEFEGMIIGFARPGFFVRLQDPPAEGLVPFTTLGRDRFLLDEGSGQVRGERTGRAFRLGERVRVRVARADPDARQVDFELLAHEPRRLPAASRSERRAVAPHKRRSSPSRRATARTARPLRDEDTRSRREPRRSPSRQRPGQRMGGRTTGRGRVPGAAARGRRGRSGR